MRGPRYWQDVVPQDLLQRLLQYYVGDISFNSESSSDSDEDNVYPGDSDEDDYTDTLLDIQLRMLLQEENLY